MDQNTKKPLWISVGVSVIVAILIYDFIGGYLPHHSIAAGFWSLVGGILSFLFYGAWALPKSKDDDGPTVI